MPAFLARGIVCSMQNHRTIIEPFKIKTVEPLALLTRAEREQHLVQAGYNLFLLRSEHIVVYTLNESGFSWVTECVDMALNSVF
jgi:tryptophanase